MKGTVLEKKTVEMQAKGSALRFLRPARLAMGASATIEKWLQNCKLIASAIALNSPYSCRLCLQL